MTHTLKQVLDDLMRRFDPAALQPHHRTTTIGFITPPPDSEQYAIELGNENATLLDHLRTADLVIQAPRDRFRAGFSEDTVDRLFNDAAVIGFGAPGDDIIIDRFLAAFHLKAGAPYPSPDQRPAQFTMPLRYPVGQNLFRLHKRSSGALPAYDKQALPQLVVDDHPGWVAMYDKAWEIAFSNLRQPQPSSGLVSDYIDTAFNGNLFMWDSCFMTMFGRYGRGLFPFIGTLDNFYARQHGDGFICREINGQTGGDLFIPFEPRSTGPNIMAWAEWLDYLTGGNMERLRAVFPALVAYHDWLRDWHTWPDGSYWTSSLGSGMDNQARVTQRQDYHGHYRWVDITMQQALSCFILQQIGDTIGRTEFNETFAAEYDHLKTIINIHMWDEGSGFYYDTAPDGSHSPVKSIGAYWGLLAGVIPEDRARRLITHLEDPASFNRPHRVPSQSADSPGYEQNGRYWRGGVWSPTNYMVLNALTRYGEDDLAYRIAQNHVENVRQVFEETGTLWENYAPESAAPSYPSKGNFVGWTGVSAINLPIEYLVGLRPDPAHNRLVWDIRLIGRHGVLAYPLHDGSTADLICHARQSQEDNPRLVIETAASLELEVRRNGERRVRQLEPGSHEWIIGI